MGAGILALPYTTQDSGFIPSSASLFGTYIFSIVTGLLLAEANVNLMCELGKVGLLVVWHRHSCGDACRVWGVSKCPPKCRVACP